MRSDLLAPLERRRVRVREGGRAGKGFWKCRYKTDGFDFVLDMQKWVEKTDKERKIYARRQIESARKRSEKRRVF